MWEAKVGMNAMVAGVLTLAAFLLACGVVWRTAIKPGLEILGELLDAIRGLKALIEPDDDGNTIPQRVSSLEKAHAEFLAKLGPMVEAISLLATRRTYRSTTQEQS